MNEGKMFGNQGSPEQIKTVGSMSVEKLRSQLINEEGWSPEYFKKFDEITEEIKRLDSEFKELARQKMTTTDEKIIADIHEKVIELGHKISDLKLELEEITLEEEMRVDNLKK